jgi:hypothetical protein
MEYKKEKPKGALEMVRQQLRPIEFSDWKPNAKDIRPDGTIKGLGFLGPLKRPDGGVSTEISVGVGLGGKEIDIPMMVPNLAKHEIDFLLNTPEDKLIEADKNLYKSIVDKAVEHAKMRLKSGKSVFAEEGETPDVPPSFE